MHTQQGLTSSTEVGPPTSGRPLARHVLYATNEVAVAESMGRYEMSPHRLRASGAVPLSARFHRAAIGSSSLLFVSYEDEVAVEASAPLDYYSLQIPLTGSVQFLQNDRALEVRPGQACVLSPSSALHVRSAAGTSKVAVKLSKQAVERSLGEMTGRGAATPHFNFTDPNSGAWTNIVRLAVQTVDSIDSGWLPATLGTRLESLIASTLILSHGHCQGELLSATVEGPAGTAASAAARILKKDPVPPRTVVELARMVGVSARTLQNGFRSQFGRTPSVYLRDLRLDLAHVELQQASPRSKGAVAEIAIRTGNSHLGRFSQAYRARFGVSPSDTLNTVACQPE